MSKKITIAIDGHSSTGKSTAAKQLAVKLHYVYVDTGAMYRAVSFFALSENLIESGQLDREKLVERLPEIKISFVYNKETDRADVYLNGKNIEKEIRTLEVSSIVSKVAEISEVRAKLVEQQQAMGTEKGIVMDGRDIGSVVFPDAELKVFMTAAPEVRAERRYVELVERGDDVTLDEVLKNVIERDHIDSNREDSPLIQLPEAKLLDTSNMTREEQFELLVSWAEAAIENS
ncbi:cytidylate kinase [Nonlabens dokdonensis]|jgi:cytidylate kinase|uniref:Cytidylate kinase n=2 Tax=Nonlabens dokdonensis TaxID=328515 RepID=L7W811_NONDD|nr:(d)CMP kinase [Nonlabens dokdonensis]AGC77805.1 cytidylate kinase [Nonlabens dokdonensis DSW-6]PZX39662.1 cytidylate kinase [Nonlabens dokdonensis]